MRSDCSHKNPDGTMCRGAISHGAIEPLCFFHSRDWARDEQGRFLYWTATPHAVFKGGTWKLTATLKGFEVDENWADVLKCNPTLAL